MMRTSTGIVTGKQRHRSYHAISKPPELNFKYGNRRFVSDTCCKQ